MKELFSGGHLSVGKESRLIRKIIAGRYVRNRTLRRLYRYVLVGGSTFLFDLLLLYFLTEQVGFPPVPSAAGAFLLAVSINYSISRTFVFAGSKRTIGGGYVGFLLIGGAGVLFVTAGMHIFVSVMHIPYLAARLLVACFTGGWNYLLNLYCNFQVAGKHL